MRKPWLLLVALFTVAVFTVQAQIGIPYTFSAGTVIDPDQMNTNFSAVGNAALNRTGGTITGTLNSMGGSLTGTWTGSPTFSGNPIFTGSPSFTGGFTVTPPGVLTVGYAHLYLRDMDNTNALVISNDGNMTNDRLLSLRMGDAARIVTFTGNPTLNDWFDQTVKVGTAPSFVGTNFSGLNGSTITTGTVADARLPATMDGKSLTNARFYGYAEFMQNPAITGGVLTINMGSASHFLVSLNANITTLALTNIPASGFATAATITFIGDGTPRTVAWPPNVLWPSALPPTMTGTLNKVDIVTLYTFNNGASVYGMLNGQNF